MIIIESHFEVRNDNVQRQLFISLSQFVAISEKAF